MTLPHPKATIDELLTIHNEIEDQLGRRIRYLERQNRKLTDRLNRYRNLLPGRKRLYALGRIAAALEHEGDLVMQTSPGDGSDIDVMDHGAYRSLMADALFLRRLEWDFEQLIDVVWEPKQARHQWPRP